MIRVTVAKTDLETVNYKSKRDGSDQSFKKQFAYAHTVDSEGNPDFAPEKFQFVPERDDKGQQRAMPAGTYTLHPSAIFVDRDGNLACRLRLTPVPAPKA